MSFDYVIVTAPSISQLQIYSTLCNNVKITLPRFQCTKFYCINDPLNVRVGSGGGTLNAIDFLANTIGEAQTNSARTLIIHSGGDSRRSPSHSVCGKAWSTLNASVGEKGDQPTQESVIDGVLATPLVLLLIEFDSFCRKLPAGSIVVSSSDVLLDIVQARL